MRKIRKRQLFALVCLSAIIEVLNSQSLGK